MITLSQIQSKIIEAIQESEYNQTQLGKLVGVSQQTISHYLKGDKLPALDTLANLCDVLDLDPYEVLCLRK